MIKMTGKEMKTYAKRFGLKLKTGVAAALLSSSKKRVQSPIKTISGIPDDAHGWFDPSINRFDASTPKTTLKVVFVGSPEVDQRKKEIVKKAEGRPTQKSGSSRPSVYDSGCGPSTYDDSGCGPSTHNDSGCGPSTYNSGC